jgi:hypothetical protein
VALIRLAVLRFGADLRSKLLLIIYASFWQILIQVLYGVQDVDPVARDTAVSYRFTTWGKIRYLVWPTALPYVMTGLRLGSAVALVLAITGELVIGAPGRRRGPDRHRPLVPYQRLGQAVASGAAGRQSADLRRAPSSLVDGDHPHGHQ